MTHQIDLAWRAPRTYIKDRPYAPAIRQDPLHCPEPGLGGACYWIHYRGDLFGLVVSTWDHEAGVHWEAKVPDFRTLAEKVDGLKVRRVFADLQGAINGLLEYAGYAADFEMKKKG